MNTSDAPVAGGGLEELEATFGEFLEEALVKLALWQTTAKDANDAAAAVAVAAVGVVFERPLVVSFTIFVATSFLSSLSSSSSSSSFLSLSCFSPLSLVAIT